jgi:hypothetical protein
MIEQIERMFCNKENYEFQIRLCVDEYFAEHTNDLNTLKNVLSDEKIKVFKVLMGINVFRTKIDKHLSELKSHYNNRLDTVGSQEHKAEYIYVENKKINELITSIYRIITSYGIQKISFKTAELELLDKIFGKPLLLENDISDGILNFFVDLAEKITNKTEEESNALINSFFFEESIPQILVENMLISISKINKIHLQVLRNNKNLLDDFYIIRRNGFLTELVKEVPEIKTENHSLTKKSTKEAKNQTEKNETTENRIWFKVGFLFANGEIDKLITKHAKGTMTNCTSIAKELGNINFRPYISESLYGKTTNDKNIFSSPDKVSFIQEYCESNDITVVESFKSRLKG